MLSDFGDDDIQLVATHYEATLAHACIDPALAEVEWTVLKARLFDEMQVPLFINH